MVITVRIVTHIGEVPPSIVAISSSDNSDTVRFSNKGFCSGLEPGSTKAFSKFFFL